MSSYNSAELQILEDFVNAKLASNYIARDEDLKNQPQASLTSTGTDIKYLVNQQNQQPYGMPYQPDIDLGYINNPMKTMNPGPFPKPDPYFKQDPFNKKYTRIAEDDQSQAQKSLIDYMKGKEDAKNEFEKLVSEIFTEDEKIEYLLSIGYTTVSRVYFKDRNGMDWNIEPAFLREMMIKFKNLLLAKSVLKIKLT